MRNSIISTFAGAILILAAAASASPAPRRSFQSDDTAIVARGLASSDPAIRQRSAEELARLVALDQTRLIEGYRTQEKDKRVILALDWALYRVGRNDKLYAVIAELEGKREQQAIGYLSLLESSEPLYPVMAQSRGKVLIGLLSVLGQIGDQRSVVNIAPYQSNFDPKVAEAARAALADIDQRSAQAPPPERAVRDRVTPTNEKPQP